MGYLREEIKAGIIVVSSLIVLSGFIILIGGRQFLEKYDVYYIQVMNASGLEEGSTVRLGGVRIGRVVNVIPPDAPSNPVTIEIAIKQGTPIYRGTKALITQVGFIGDIYLLLSLDNTTSETFRPGDTIPSEERVSFPLLMARLERLSRSVDNLIVDVDTVFSGKNRKGIETFIENANRAISSLKTTSDKMSLTLGDIGDVVGNNKEELSIMLKKASDAAVRAENAVKVFEETVMTINTTSRSLNKAIDIQSQNITVLIQTLIETTEDLQETLQEIKNKPWSVLYKEGTESNE